VNYNHVRQQDEMHMSRSAVFTIRGKGINTWQIQTTAEAKNTA
jgi:hypothetical protein